MKKYYGWFMVILLIITVVILFSRTRPQVQYDTNDHIDNAKRATVQTLHEQLFNSIYSANEEAIDDMLALQLKNASPTASTQVINTIESYQISQTQIMDEFDILVKRDGKGNNRYDAGESASYYLDVAIHESERYIVFSTSQVKEAEYIIATSFVRENNEWKVIALYVANYGSEGMRAQALCERAKAEKNSGNLLSAYLYAQAAYEASKPFEYYHEKNEKEIEKDCFAIIDEAKKFFAMEFTWDDVRYRILDMQAVFFESGIQPSIRFNSDSMKTDTTEEELRTQGTIVRECLYDNFPELEQFDNPFCMPLISLSNIQ